MCVSQRNPETGIMFGKLPVGGGPTGAGAQTNGAEQRRRRAS